MAEEKKAGKENPMKEISIEKITTRKDVSIRGRKIVADFISDRARLEIDRERNVIQAEQEVQ